MPLYQLRIFVIAIACFAVVVVDARAQQPPSAPSSDTAAPVIRFLDRATARREIVAQDFDNYFGELTRAEMSAKTGSPIVGENLPSMRAECRRRYQDAVLEFAPDERFIVRLYIQEQYPALAEMYPVLGRLPWNLIKVADNLEGGMIFTRGENIVIPQNRIRQMLDMSVGPGNERDVEQLDRLLIHEQFHVLQRLRPDLFTPLYQNLWGLIPVEEFENASLIRPLTIANPDVSGPDWVIPVRRNGGNKYLLPIIAGRRNDQGELTPYFSFEAVQVEPLVEGFAIVEGPDGGPVRAELTRGMDAGVSLYASLLPMVGGPVHPHEISAPLFARIFTRDAFEPGDDSTRDRGGRRARFRAVLDRHRQWFDRNLGPTAVAR